MSSRGVQEEAKTGCPACLVREEPWLFQGRYPYVKRWRREEEILLGASGQGVIQDKIPLSKPFLRLILLIPGDKDRMIQDEIRLRRQSRRTFVADGYG